MEIFGLKNTFLVTLYLDISVFRYKKTNPENVSYPKVGVLNVEFVLKLRIYSFLKSLICLKLILKNLTTTLHT